MTTAGNGDRGSLLALLSDKEFWEPNGRVGVITQGKYTNRLILFHPEPTPGQWAEVVSSSLEEGPLDSYILADEYAANVLEEYGVVWLARSNEEVALEQTVFDWRQVFRPARRSLKQSIRELLGRNQPE
ncbi:hypothetical protein SRABI83_03656 [Arthrobacter sp. Bi83]|jgi:hypothetical protein|uniref:hypothetical protein n=1 Tax=Arthrobacter sp. Bi83 TaxID=2822353 RepID=UPI001D2C3F86|nr:hypothetical protein [Arthrobacter sp. Bi83]CAH0271302.1 hypothetical protein SRABI83_03656 [Arthrobacter sp. Bi83]